MKLTVVYNKWRFFDVAKSWYIQNICLQVVSINKISVWHNSKFICDKLRKLCRIKYSCASNDTSKSWSSDSALIKTFAFVVVTRLKKRWHMSAQNCTSMLDSSAIWKNIQTACTDSYMLFPPYSRWTFLGLLTDGAVQRSPTSLKPVTSILQWWNLTQLHLT